MTILAWAIAVGVPTAFMAWLVAIFGPAPLLAMLAVFGSIAVGCVWAIAILYLLNQ